MTAPSDDPTSMGLLELWESARTKYNLALSRARHGPTDLALLSLHGSLEDALRAHGLRIKLAEVRAPLLQLIEAFTTTTPALLSEVEADGIRRMHQLRARIARGEQIAVAASTITAYHQLVARLLQRVGLTVVAPEPMLSAEPEPVTNTTTTRRRPGASTTNPPRSQPRPRGEGGQAADETGPRRERTTYPDEQLARYVTRGTPSAATRDLPLARELLQERQSRWWNDPRTRVERMADFWVRARPWLFPILVVASLLSIIILISVNFQPSGGAMFGVRSTPVPLMVTNTTLPTITGLSALTPAEESTQASPTTLTPIPELTPIPANPTAGSFAVGQIAYVRVNAPRLELRQDPNLKLDNPVLLILEQGTPVRIVAGPVTSDGMEWWRVSAAGVEGWSIGGYLELR